MASNVCVGPAFARALDGTLIPRLAGGPADTAMPATGNGLRVDPSKGLWAPSQQHVVQVAASHTDAPGNRMIATGNNWSGTIVNEDVVNPSATRPLLVSFTVTHSATFRIPEATDDNAGWTGWQLLAGLDTDAASATAAMPVAEMLSRRDQGVTTGESRLMHQATQTGHILIPPGETSRVRARTGLGCYEFGYVRVVQLATAIRGIAVST